MHVFVHGRSRLSFSHLIHYTRLCWSFSYSKEKYFSCHLECPDFAILGIVQKFRRLNTSQQLHPAAYRLQSKMVLLLFFQELTDLGILEEHEDGCQASLQL